MGFHVSWLVFMVFQGRFMVFRSFWLVFQGCFIVFHGLRLVLIFFKAVSWFLRQFRIYYQLLVQKYIFGKHCALCYDHQTT